MQERKRLQQVWSKIPFAFLGIVLVLAALVLLFWVNTTNSYQSTPAFFPEIYFEGQYKIADGPWHDVVKGQHISSTQGDVTLKGRFHMTAPDGEYLGVAGEGVLLALYMNHIHVTVQEEGQEAFNFDIESDFGGEGLCGELCLGYSLVGDGPVTLTFRNNHHFGNENAIDDFLQELSVYGDLTFEKEFMAQGAVERNAGLAFVIIALVLLGTALFSSLLHLDATKKLWLIGLTVFFAGGYFAYGSKGVFFWSDSVIGNTTILGGCMMLYMLCICMLIISAFKGKTRRVGIAAVALLVVACTALGLCSMTTVIRFYDAWLWWVIVQSVVNVVILGCLALGLPGAKKRGIASSIGAAFLLLGFEADLVGTAFGWWQGGLVCKYIFILLLAISVVMVWRIIPHNINAARKAREMEAEQKVIRAQLQESRIAIMISQIQPHFIYNTLGTIQQLCKENPQQASELVRNFSLYLRGNFSELDNTTPIRFAKELEHVRCYTEIELIRFPDMTVNYDIQTEDFLLPALTVQPLVENAIKHGLMGREEGGTVTVTVYETETHYCVKVTDDGVGFDHTTPWDKGQHIGIRNVRERLQVMCGGTLTVESQKGKGTTALIQIPKEGMTI